MPPEVALSVPSIWTSNTRLLRGENLMPDKTTKILLGVIALGLWANIAVSMFRPITAVAQSLELTKIQRDVSDLALIASA
jgi:hypothetical protein